jgi:integrase
MKRRTPTPHVWWRRQGDGTERAYADLRRWGLGYRVLRIPGQHRGLTREQADVAEALAAQMVADAIRERARADQRAAFARVQDLPLADAVREHLLAKARSGHVTDACIAADERFLKRFVEYCGATRRLSEIDTRAVRQFVEWLRTLPGRRGGTLDDATIRHHLNAISNMYRRARAEGWAPKGHDPVGDLIEKPTPNPDEPLWLEVSEAALYLAAARKCPAGPAAVGHAPVPFGYELIATYLLTGGRQDEVLGLEISDVDLARRTIAFRPNAWRRLKTAKSHRTVPLWPQLRQILGAYLAGPHAPAGRLLFPSYCTGEERMLTDIRKLLDRVTERVGAVYVMDRGARRKAKRGEIRTKVFRHTYITARLQTLDRGAPVSLWTVAREVGHSGTAMIERVYGHLGDVRHRASVVEYRVRQHRRVLRGRLELVA